MKKTVSILSIIVILIMGMFLLTGCTKDTEETGTSGEQVEGTGEVATEQEETNDNGSEVDLSGYLGTKTGKFYSKFSDGKMYMEYESEYQGQKSTIISATNGKKTYSETKIDGKTVGSTVMEEGVLYTIDHSSKMVIKMTTNIPDSQTIATSIIEESDVDMTNLKTGTREIDGKTYETEEWTIEDSNVVMCFDGNDLAYMISSYSDEEMVIKIVEISDKVDEKLFEIPSDYQMLEM